MYAQALYMFSVNAGYAKQVEMSSINVKMKLKCLENASLINISLDCSVAQLEMIPCHPQAPSIPADFQDGALGGGASSTCLDHGG